MRRLVFTTLAILIPAAALAQDDDSEHGHSSQARNQLPAATAEPDNVQAYAPPVPYNDEEPTSEDRGPAQRPYIIASEKDTLASDDNPPTVENLPPDSVALDKRIRIDLIHDVENDATYNGGSNHALLFEIKYINFGAVTSEQLQARRGHYFTISWSNRGARDNFIVRFRYREVRSHEIVRTLEEPMNQVHGTVRSYFAVVGKAYAVYGPVASWEISILKAGTVVAQARSFIW
jgi:hypothetical protein